MNTPRVIGVLAGLVLLSSGCGIPLTSDDLPPRVPDVTIGAGTPTAGPASPASTAGGVVLPAGCEVPTAKVVEYALSEIEEGFVLGWLAAVQVDDVLAIQQPVYSGPEPTGTTVAYGSTIVDSAQVDAGDGYVIVAARLSEPTGPEGSDAAAWVWAPDTGWVEKVSDGWRVGGVNDHRALPWGQLARAAALACLG